ncbi:MAG: peptidoglycan bridge formation glycyltransferase FemA/FemB family protein [Candidatus Gracilibacteria bacterium]|nr:peptidoglycan bridge formation glycyltransferase FemA/FemB family protein [Candidatus Gracilibacteria bacterium]
MSIWQTKNWKNMLISSSQALEVFEIDNIFVEKRTLSLGQNGLFILGFEGNIEKKLEEKLISLAKKNNSLFVQIEDFDILGNFKNHNLDKFKKGYYKKFITNSTAIIDLNLEMEDILLIMKPKGRYNIKVAEKKGLKAFEIEKIYENIKIFYNLMLETTSRDNFNGNNFEYYKTFLNNISNSKLIFVKLENEVVCGGIFVFDKEISIYYYGASTSSPKYRNMMGPYLMQYFAINKAKELGSKIYDFLGVAGILEKNSPLAGVTDFKLKLTPNVVEVSNSYIYKNKKILYFIFQILRYLKK